MIWPKISIVTPSLNQVSFIEQTIQSVLDQKYPNLEYVMIDGGSTDGTVEVIKRYEEHLAYWISEPDRGQSHAINKGFQKCTGDLVGWQNSDDFYLPSAFEKVARAYQEREADVYFGHMYVVNQNGKIIRPQCYTPFSLKTYIYEGIMVANHSAFWRRELFDRLGYLDENLHYAMDYEYFLRMGFKDCRFRLVNDFLGCFRSHGEAKSTQLSHKWDAEFAYIDQMYQIRRPARRINIGLSLLRRAWHYLRQGNFHYAFMGLRARLFPSDDE